jgi:hypothetical protein
MRRRRSTIWSEYRTTFASISLYTVIVAVTVCNCNYMYARLFVFHSRRCGYMDSVIEVFTHHHYHHHALKIGGWRGSNVSTRGNKLFAFCGSALSSNLIARLHHMPFAASHRPHAPLFQAIEQFFFICPGGVFFFSCCLRPQSPLC